MGWFFRIDSFSIFICLWQVVLSLRFLLFLKNGNLFNLRWKELDCQSTRRASFSSLWNCVGFWCVGSVYCSGYFDFHGGSLYSEKSRLGFVKAYKVDVKELILLLAEFNFLMTG